MTMPFPSNLLYNNVTKGSEGGVYPSDKINFFYIPVSMAISTYFESSTSPPIVNIDISNYAGFYWTME